MPVRRRVWSSWNYLGGRDAGGERAVSVTYWMNRLQNLDARNDYFVSLNPLREPAPAAVLRELEYAHPVFDAAALRFQTPLLESTATGMGRDVDRDGLIGEDPPADINGDGLITWMRVPDVAGEYIADPFDARLTVKADGKHGERGMWKLIREGLDQDGDDEIAEDQPRDTELNRNFPAGYTPHTASGGLYGGSEPEARALMDEIQAAAGAVPLPARARWAVARRAIFSGGSRKTLPDVSST